MPANELLILGFSVWFFVKLLLLFGIAVYLVFAVVVIRQVGLMTETVDMPFDPTLRTLAWAHLIFAMSVFLIALFAL